MQVYNEDHNEPLKPALQEALNNFKAKRGFNPATYAKAKASLINEYFRNTPLKTAIIALSGGIDSSVVAGLISYAMRQDNSPITNILTPTIPAHSIGATGQNDAEKRALDVMDNIRSEHLVIDITEPHKALTQAVEKSMVIDGDEWAKGQSVAHVRTMALAYCATLMQMQDKSGILIGTTNRDEGAYLGYVGKYSDAMVDLQVISDLHKSEVFALARHLNLPDSTINAIPKGDMYDDRPDTEVFGASYDFVELYLNYLELSVNEKEILTSGFNEVELNQFKAMAGNLEELHKYNGHKYIGNQSGSIAYHLDILRSGVPNGWENTVPVKAFIDPPQVVKQNMPGHYEMAKTVRDEIASRVIEAKLEPSPITYNTIKIPHSCDYREQNVTVVNNLLSGEEVTSIVNDALNQSNSTWIPVGNDGRRESFNLMRGDKIGSFRATTFSTELGELIWQRLKHIIPAIEVIPEGLSVDAQGTEVWRPVGVNTKLSFIMYRPEDAGNLVTHYDAPYEYDDGRKTLKTLLLYFSDAVEGEGGSTRFVVDPQASTPPLDRNLDDADGNAFKEEVTVQVTPSSGSALIFNHRVWHDSEPLSVDAETKLVARSDIVYERVLTP